MENVSWVGVCEGEWVSPLFIVLEHKRGIGAFLTFSCFPWSQGSDKVESQFPVEFQHQEESSSFIYWLIFTTQHVLGNQLLNELMTKGMDVQQYWTGPIGYK